MNCMYDGLRYEKACRPGAAPMGFWTSFPVLLVWLLLFLPAPGFGAQPKIDITPPANFTKGTPNYQMKFHTTSSGMPGSGGSHRMVNLELSAQPGPAGGAVPSAWHMIPPGMQMGEYLPLVPPARQSAPGHSGGRGDPGYKPEKMIIKTYWGCSDTVRPGQPNVLDTSKISPQNMPDMSALAPKGAGAYGAYGGGPARTGKNMVLWPN